MTYLQTMWNLLRIQAPPFICTGVISKLIADQAWNIEITDSKAYIFYWIAFWLIGCVLGETLRYFGSAEAYSEKEGLEDNH